MASKFVKKDGRLQDENGNWIWDGESYEFVNSHTDWLPMNFKSTSDAEKFEKLEKIWKAKEKLKTTRNLQERSLIKAWLKMNDISHSDFLEHHGIKGQKWGVENGPPYPLNDTIKAIAYRGGELTDGRKAVNFTAKDVKKARKIVNKNLKTMTSDEIKEYKARLALESEMGEILGTNYGSKLQKKLKDNAVDAVADSLKTTGTKVLANAEMAAVGEIISNTLGADAASMITNGLSKYDLAKEAYNRNQKAQENKLKEQSTYQDKMAKISSLSTAYNQSQNEDIKRAIRDIIVQEDPVVQSPSKKSQSTDTQSQAVKKETPKAENPKGETIERVQGEIVENTKEPDYKYVDKEKNSDGTWTYYYEPPTTGYELMTVPNWTYYNGNNSSSKKSSKKRKKK